MNKTLIIELPEIAQGDIRKEFEKYVRKYITLNVVTSLHGKGTLEEVLTSILRKMTYLYKGIFEGEHPNVEKDYNVEDVICYSINALDLVNKVKLVENTENGEFVPSSTTLLITYSE